MPKIQDVKKRVQAVKPNAVNEYVKPQPKVIEDCSIFKPQAIVSKSYNMILAWILFALTLTIYITTQARTMSFWDSGEYATCISILGVPHPPGNPFYILFGRAIVAIFGSVFSHAMISAFLSGLTSAFAVMFTYLFTVKLVSMLKVKGWEAMLAGSVAALYTAFSFTFWMNAIEAEVYSGLVFFVNMIIWLTLVWVEKSDDYNHQNILLLIVYLFFLGFCVHQTALQIAPAILFIIVYPMLQKGVRGDNFWVKVFGYTLAILAGYFIFGGIGKGLAIDDFDKWGFAFVALVILCIELKEIFGKKFWLLSIALVLIGLSSHLYLMIRAADRPFINEGHPSSLKAFQDYVLRKQYGNTSFIVRRGNFFKDQIVYHFLRYFGMQWFPEGLFAPIIKLAGSLGTFVSSLFVLLVGFFGGVFQYKRNRHSFNYFFSILLFTTIIMVFVMNLSNAEVRDRDYFFVVAYNMWAVWLGIGTIAIVSLFKSEIVKYVLAAILLLFPIGNMVTQYHVHDRSNEFIALDYGVNFLNSLEENAIIFTNGDNDTFPLWYAQAVQDPFAKEYMHQAKDVYPSDSAQAAIKSAMEYKNKYLKGIRKDVSIANLSLLNTPWYIRQLRDKEGILFNYPDSAIDELRITKLQNNLVVPGTVAAPGFTIELDPTPPWRQAEPFYRVSDLSVMQIIKDNFGHRPIYFAVTCESFIGFEKYTRNEGMVAHLVSYPGENMIDPDRLLKNIDELYEYRSINDRRVYKDENMRRLVLNYGSGFEKAATYFSDQGDYQKAKSYIARAKVFVDDEIKFTEFYTRFYSSQRDWAQLNDFIENVIFPHPQGWRIYLSYVISHLIENYPDECTPYIEKGLLRFPSEQYFAQLTLHYGKEFDKQNEMIALLNKVKSQLQYDIAPYVSDLQSDISNR